MKTTAFDAVTPPTTGPWVTTCACARQDHKNGAARSNTGRNEHGHPTLTKTSQPQENNCRTLSKNDLLIGLASSPHDSANSCSFFFCAEFNRVGTSTITRTCWSPRPWPWTFETPLPL